MYKHSGATAPERKAQIDEPFIIYNHKLCHAMTGWKTMYSPPLNENQFWICLRPAVII